MLSSNNKVPNPVTVMNKKIIKQRLHGIYMLYVQKSVLLRFFAQKNILV